MRFAVLGVLLSLSPAFLGCGSKTGLDLLPSDDDIAIDGGGPECALARGRLAQRLEQRIPEVLFVIDASGSMRNGLDGSEVPTEESRWALLGAALLSIVDSRDEDFGFGAAVFPHEPSFVRPCDVRSSPLLSLGGSNNRTFLRRLFERWVPNGATPTARALHVVREHVRDPPPNVQRFVVLATDGAPNCNPTPSVLPPDCVCTNTEPGWCVRPRDAIYCLDENDPVEAVRALTDEDGVPVYVIGLHEFDNPAYRRILDAMATAGRRPQRGGENLFYGVREVGDLERVLGGITASLTRCVYYLGGALEIDEVVAVQVGDTTVPRDDGGVEGWSVSNPSAGEITLHGSACMLAEGTEQTPVAYGACR